MKEAKHYSSPKGGGREGAMTDIIFDLGGVLLDLNLEGIGQACQR